jgi:hypothetical protein
MTGCAGTFTGAASAWWTLLEVLPLHLTHPCYCEMVRAELLLLSCRGEASDAI